MAQWKARKPSLQIELPSPPLLVNWDEPQHTSRFKTPISDEEDVDYFGRLYQPSRYEWWTDGVDSNIHILLIAPEIMNRQPSTSDETDLPPRHHYHSSSHPTLETLPNELTTKIFGYVSMVDRVHLALCNKDLAEIAIENKQLQLAKEHRYTLCEDARWFDQVNRYVEFDGTPDCCFHSEEGWQPKAKAEIERQGGIFTRGVELAISRWWIDRVVRWMTDDNWTYEGSVDERSDVEDNGQDNEDEGEDRGNDNLEDGDHVEYKDGENYECEKGKDILARMPS